jgi:predicted kinase
MFPGLYSEDVNGEVVFHGGEMLNGVPRIKLAHQWCQRVARNLLEESIQEGGCTVVANTFSQKWETRAYFKMAEDLGVKCHLIDLYDQGLNDIQLAARNRHGVNAETIAKMRARWMQGAAKVWRPTDWA